MKREDFGWLVAGVVISLAVTMGAMQSAGQPGRWCLYSFDHSVFLLDTQTGATSVKGEYAYWVDLETEAQRSLRLLEEQKPRTDGDEDGTAKLNALISAGLNDPNNPFARESRQAEEAARAAGQLPAVDARKHLSSQLPQ